jgi:ribosomal protein S18 acetylase RimI-like enzyme
MPLTNNKLIDVILSGSRKNETIERLIDKEIRLRDSSKLRLRQLHRGNREKLKAFFSRCSPEAIRCRFMSSIKALSDSLLDYLADPDESRHVALILSQQEGEDERIVAEGRYVVLKEQPDAADIALLVVDDMQRRGIATLLIRELTEIAVSNGVTRFRADVLADNRAMISLLRKTYRPVSTTINYGVIHYELSIAGRENRLSEAA